MMNPNCLLSEQAKIVAGLGPIVPSTSTPDYVSLKGYSKLTALIFVLNTTTVTGSAITLKQATDVSGTSEKALAFSTARRNVDCAAADSLADFAVSSNTFTTDATNSKQLLYEITVNESDLDNANGFDCVRIGTGNAVNATVAVLYLLWPAKYGKSTPVSAILD
jgi:hypothetical protein